MSRTTHICVSLALSLPLIHIIPACSLIGLIGSITPDFDLYTLGLIKHRTLTHGLFALIVSTLVVMFFNYPIGIVYGYNYLIHLILDSFTKMGVPLFYPVSKKYYGFRFMKTGDCVDLLLRVAAIIFIFK